MKFTKLALAAAVAAAPSAGLAMEPMDDSQLSSVTGQDGLSIGLNVNQTMDIIIEDTDGAAQGAYTNTGSIVISNAGLNTAGNTMDIDIDAGGDAGTAAGNGLLEINVSIPNNTVLTTGDIGVADGDGSGNTGATSSIIPSTNITLTNGMDLRLELGNEVNAFATLTGNLGTVTFGTAGNAGDNFSIEDGSSNQQIVMDELSISGLDVTGTTIDVTANGLQIVNGSNLNNVNIDITALSLDNGTTTVGNVYIQGLDMAGDTITINGK
jgi:hypothetical protein